jgi:hypothetical protein
MLIRDYCLHVPGYKVYAHKVVLAARNDIMSAMFNGSFTEGSNGVSMVTLQFDVLLSFLSDVSALFEFKYQEQMTIHE